MQQEFDSNDGEIRPKRKHIKREWAINKQKDRAFAEGKEYVNTKISSENYGSVFSRR